MDNTIKIPTEKCLEQMIIREEEIRMSKEYQDECSKVKDVVNGWLDVTAKMQSELVKEFGFTDEVSSDIAVNMLRRARYLYPDNNIFKTVPVYVRENKANEGKLKENDECPNIQLFTNCKQQIKLHDLLENDTLNVIFASSHT